MLEYSTVQMSNYQSFIQPTKIFPRHKKELTFSLDCYSILRFLCSKMWTYVLSKEKFF